MIRLRTACLAVLLGWAGAMPRPAAALDLEGVMREVAALNPTLTAHRAMVEAARRRISPAGAWQSPMVELGAINVPANGRFDMDPMTMKMVGVSQRVPLFGANRLAGRSAREAAAEQGAGSAMAHYERFGMAFEAYADAWYSGVLARDAELHGGVMDRLVRSARARYESGNGRLEDVLRAEAERARTRADLAAFGAEERAARARLDALRGSFPGEGRESLAPPPSAPVPASPEPWLVSIAPDHPRLREMDARARRYRFAARAARRMLWPDLQLEASYGKRETLEDGTPQDDMWSATAGFMVPLFAGQRELSEGAEMDAMARASEAERREAELELRREVVAVHAAAAAAQATVRLIADTVVTTQRRAVDASWSAYGAGATDLWRVFEASHSLYAEEIALTRARQDLARAQGRMLSLTGRGDLIGIALPPVKEGER